MLPSGEKRIGVENAGIALGYSARFFFQRTKRESKALKTLRDMGFSGEQIWVEIVRFWEKIEEGLPCRKLLVYETLRNFKLCIL